MDGRKRCGWVPLNDEDYVSYHDKEWGVPVHDDNKLFEFIVLEGAQAGLSWKTILQKREGYRSAFCSFDPSCVALYDDEMIRELVSKPEIIRNRLKIRSAVTNANAFLKVQVEHGSFSSFIWDYVGNSPVVGNWKSQSDVPARTPLSDSISKDLKKRGFKFMGSTICYSFLQATGIVNDHTRDCFRFGEILGLEGGSS